MSFPPFPSLWSKGNHGIVAELMEMCKISQGIAHSSWQIVGTLRKSFSPPMTPWRLWWSHLFVVQSLSRVWHFVTRWSTAHQACLSITISQSLHKLMSIESEMASNHLILCHPVSCPQSFPAEGSFPMSWLFSSGGQNIGASASVLPKTIQSWLL